MANPAAVDLYDLLATRDFEVEVLDRAGKAVTDPAEAEIFSFDWKTQDKNYGTVVVLLGQDQDLQVFFGDNLGQTMEGDDKTEWYDFLHQMKNWASRNMMTFQPQNIRRLKKTMQGMAAIKEGLFEGYYGSRRTSYTGGPRESRLMIRHSRDLGEHDARYRAIDSLFIETQDGQRFRLPFKNLMGGKAMLRHVNHGGTPYDAFGQHICEMVTEINTLARFLRAAKHKDFQEPARSMIETAVRHYQALKSKARRMLHDRGYMSEKNAFDPAHITETEQLVDEIRDMFIETNLDQRIEDALPILARLDQNESVMREADDFESWADRLVEGTWALPDTLEKQRKLQQLMSSELIVGADATNATEQLYDLVGDDVLFDILDDLALRDPDANIWDDPKVQQRLIVLGVASPETTQDNTSAVTKENFGGTGLQGAPAGVAAGSLNPGLMEQPGRYQPVRISGAPPKEGDIHDLPGGINFSMLPGLDRVRYQDDDYSDTFYYQDPISKGVFSIYFHGHIPRIRGTDGMPETRVEEIARSLSVQTAREDLDTDGVMMTRPSNMSSESRQHNDVDRIVELAKI